MSLKHHSCFLSLTSGIITGMKYQYILFILSFLSLLAFSDNSLNLESPDYKERLKAVELITDQAELEKLAFESKYRDVRSAAIAKLTDQALLAKLALEDKYSFIRLSAIKNLTDQIVLAKLIMDEKDKHIRCAALKNLTSQALLSKVIMEDKDVDVRRAAVKNLTDQVLLTKLVIEDKDEEVRSSAARNITNQKLLEKLAVEAAYWKVREGAIENLNNENLLARIAVEDLYSDVRKAAETKVVQKPQGRALVREAGMSSEKRLRMADESGDQTELEKAALQDSWWRVRETAVKKITNQSLLYRLITEDYSDFVRRAAARSLSSQDLLAKAAVENNNADVRSIVVTKLTDVSLLAKIATDDKDAYVRKAAAAKLDEQKIDDIFSKIVSIPAFYSDQEVKEWFDKNVPDINQKNKEGVPLLHKAITDGRVIVIKELLSRGANVNAADKEGQTVFHVAVRKPQPEILEIMNLLIQYKADVNARDQYGQTVLHAAVCNPRPEIIDLLIRQKVDVNARNNEGGTPLHYMARTFDIGQEKEVEMVVPKECMMLLFNHGARIIDDNRGNSPLEQVQSWVPQTQKGRKYQSEMISFLSQNQGDLPAKITAAQKDLYDEDVYTRRKTAMDLYHMGDSSSVPIMIESLRVSECPLTLSIANAVLREITGNDFCSGESLRHLPKNHQQEVIKKWMKWWEDNKGSIKAAQIDKDRLVKVLKNDPAQRQQYFARLAEKEKNNPELPKFKDSQHTPTKTLESFMAAIKAGDDAKALSFMFYPVAEEYKPVLKQFTKFQRQCFIEDMGKNLFFDANLGNMLSYRILVEDDENIFASPISFVEDGEGNWIITGM